MKRIALIAVLLFGLTSAADARVMDVFHFSGNEWVTWSTPSKYGFIGGFIAGGAYVAIGSQTDMIDNALVDEKEPDEIMGDDSGKDVISTLIMYLQDDSEKDLARYFIKGLPSNKIVDGLDALYKNRHHRRIRVVDAVYLVRKQYEGASAEEILATIEYLVSGKNIQKLHYKDKAGKFKAVTFP